MALTANYLFFFSRFACLFSSAVFWGVFFFSFLTSLGFDIRFPCLTFPISNARLRNQAVQFHDNIKTFLALQLTEVPF